MYGIALTLSDSDIENLSAYYASLKSNVGMTQDNYLELGRNIYRGGIWKLRFRHVLAAMVLMDRNYAAAIPMLSGQHSQYTYQQLKIFKHLFDK